MQKIGTISFVVGLIFFSIWLLSIHIDRELANQFFKWWPIMIIIIGIEILLHFRKHTHDKKLEFNSSIFLILIGILVINTAQNLYIPMQGVFVNRLKTEIANLLASNDKPIHAVKTVDITNNQEIVILAKTGSFNVKRSWDNTLRIEAELYIDTVNSFDVEDIKETQDANSIIFDFGEELIKKCSADIYVPEGCRVRFEASNLKILSIDSGIEKLVVNSQNGVLETENIKNMQGKLSTGEVKVLGKSANVNLNIDRGIVDLNGHIDNMEIAIGKGKVSIYNQMEMYTDIAVQNGVVIYKTQNQNASVTLETDNGICMMNGRKLTAGKTVNTFGTGNSRISIKVGEGTIRYFNEVNNDDG